MWKNKESSYFLIEVIRKIKKEGYSINNIDATVILKSPKLSSYIQEIKKKIASVSGLSKSQISVKATTTDNLGFVGDGSGWSALAIATLST